MERGASCLTAAPTVFSSPSPVPLTTLFNTRSPEATVEVGGFFSLSPPLLFVPFHQFFLFLLLLFLWDFS